jgi:hypothetical protein
MEILLIHKPRGIVPPEMMAAALEIGKKIMTNPGQVVPGGKLIGSYHARAIGMLVCLWEVPSIEALMPVGEQMSMMGWDTDIIPVDKMEVALAKFEKALQGMQAK